MSLFQRFFTSTRWRKDSGQNVDGLRIRVTDPADTPVEGAHAGDIISGNWDSDQMLDGLSPDERFHGVRVMSPSGKIAVLRFIHSFPVAVSGADGIIRIPRDPLSVADPKWQTDRPEVICVIHPGRRIGGFVCCRAVDLGGMAELTLEPLCHVHGRISREDGEHLPAAKTFAFWGPMRPWHLTLAEQGGVTCEVDIMLPPGRYWLKSMLLITGQDGITRSLEKWKSIRIARHQTELDVEMNLSFAKHKTGKALSSRPRN